MKNENILQDMGRTTKMTDTDTTPKYPNRNYCKFCGKPMRCFDGDWVCTFFFCEMKEQVIETEENN